MAKKPDHTPHAAPKPDDLPLSQQSWQNIKQGLFGVLRYFVKPSPPRLMTFSIKRADSMALIADIVVGWVPSVSPGVAKQEFAATAQDGSAAPQTFNQTFADNTTNSFTIPGLHAGATIQASVISDTGVVQSPALQASYTVPDLTAPASATGMTFTPTNLRDDGTGTTAATPPAAPSEPATTTPAT